MGDGQSIWKKEITLGRKAKGEQSAADTPEAEPKTESPSVWKKDISFSRKPKEPKPVAAEAGSPSVWKKEFSLSRRPKEPTPVAVESESPSVWKKEISFGRKKDAASDPGEPTVPWWKKEVNVGRKTKAKEIERLAAEAAAAVTAPPEELRQQPLAPVVPEVLPEPDPAATAPTPEPVSVAPPLVEPQAKPLPPEAEVVFTAPPLAPAEPVSPATLAEEQTAVLPPQPEPWEAPPQIPPAPEPVAPAAQQAVHPPVPASELPSLEAAPPTPWWKKEIGGGKKSKLLPEDDAPKTPWYKKELGGRSKKASAPARVLGEPVAPEAATLAEAAAKTPFWKKDLSLARKPKRGTADGLVPAQAKPRAKSSSPFWKLELSSLSLPSLPALSGGGKNKRNAKLKKLVGLKIGGSQIAAARVANNGYAELLQVARQPLEQGIIVGGELRDPDALSEQLKAFFARHKLPRRNVRLGIASNRIGVRIFDVAGITDDKALTNAIQFRAQEALPIPLDEAVLDYQVLSETIDSDGKPVKRILLVVAYRELVDRYLAACRKAGISLVGIDLEAFALLRALAAPRPEAIAATAALVAVAVGHDRSTFAVSDGRVCEFTRVLEWGGTAINVGLARALDKAPSEVEAIKRSLALDGSQTPEGLAPEQLAVAVDAVRKQIQAFARELVSSLQFYQNQPGSLGIGEIVLSGGTAHLPGLAEELQRLIGVSVRVGDPLARVKVAKKVGSPEQLGSLAVAIGLGIED